MAKFSKGQWVRKGHQQGIVSGLRGHSVLVRWAGSQKGVECGSKSLVPCPPPQALILEGALEDLESTRSEEDLLRNWLGSKCIPVAYTRVLTLEDIAVVGREVGKKRPTFVHISCHGDYDGSRPYIQLAPGRAAKNKKIYLDDGPTTECFKNAFKGLPLLFSACLLGKHESAMLTFQKAAELTSVAAFTKEVDDHEAMLFELLLYQGTISNGWTFKNAAEKACKALSDIGIRGGQGHGQSFVRVFRG